LSQQHAIFVEVSTSWIKQGTMQYIKAGNPVLPATILFHSRQHNDDDDDDDDDDDESSISTVPSELI
jgi:hypothetical protein